MRELQVLDSTINARQLFLFPHWQPHNTHSTAPRLKYLLLLRDEHYVKRLFEQIF